MGIRLKDIADPFAETLTFAQAATGVASAVATAKGLVPGAGPLGVAAAVANGKIDVTLTGGTDGEQYEVVVSALHAGVAPSQRSFEVATIAGGWTMDDGSAGWLSLVGFADRVGLNELVSASDADGAGLFDRGFIIGKLRDAQSECEAAIADRYALPLASVPNLLKSIVSDLARPRLFPRGIPDGVAEAAKVARANLGRIASGAMKLPDVAGVPVAGAPTSDAPIEYYAEPRAYPDGLAGY